MISFCFLSAFHDDTKFLFLLSNLYFPHTTKPFLYKISLRKITWKIWVLQLTNRFRQCSILTIIHKPMSKRNKGKWRPTRWHPLTWGGLYRCVHLIPVKIIIIWLTIATGTKRLIKSTASCKINTKIKIKQGMQVTDYESPILTTTTQFNASCKIFKCLLIQIIIHLLIITFFRGNKTFFHENKISRVTEQI